MSDAIEAALLTCPFCGASPVWRQRQPGGRDGSFDAPERCLGCPNAKCVQPHTEWLSKERFVSKQGYQPADHDAEHIAAWNRRPALTAYEAAKGGGVDYFGSLVEKARAAAAKASIKFPQPNYVTLKIAEEAGEVVRGAVHYAENRMEWSEVEGEIVQLLAMLIRFVTEGDQINGVTPPPHALTSPASGEQDAPAGRPGEWPARMTTLIHAFTPPTSPYPPYINISRMADGSVKVIVRNDAGGSAGVVCEIILSEADWRSLAWSVHSESEDHMRQHGRPVPRHGSGGETIQPAPGRPEVVPGPPDGPHIPPKPFG